MRINKLLVYLTLGVVGVVVVAMFVTATTYMQLGIAMVIYPVLVYFGYKAFLAKSYRVDRRQVVARVLRPIKAAEATLGVADVDKRGFLKLIGAAGLSWFVFSLIGKRVELPWLNRLSGGTDKASADTTDAYKISEIADGPITYYGFVKAGGAWFIMQEDTEGGTFRYVKGTSGFAANWAKREQLTFDYYDNVF